MHKIIIISNSKFKAKTTTRSILDKYCERVSKNVWVVNISEIGLNSLIEECKQSVSKKISISFFKNDFCFLHIGNKILRDQAKYIKVRKIKTNMEKILKIAGYFHDLGKATSSFQNMLISNTKEKYILPHDLMSILILKLIYATDLKQLLKMNKITFKSLFKINEKDKDKTFQKYLYENDFFYKNNNINYNYIGQLCLIFGTHHSLPSKSTDFNTFYAFNKIENPKDKKITSDKLFKILEDTEILLSKNDIKNIKNKINDYLTIRKHLVLTEKDMFLLRSSVILGDHIASGIKQIEKLYLKELSEVEKKEFKYLHAKSIDRPYQTLGFHTAMVQKKSLYAYQILSKKENPFEQYSELNLKDKIKEEYKEKDKEKFNWQKKSLDFIESNIDNDLPTLSFLLASTGSGKTRFGIKYTGLISKLKRLTILQGLKNLTLQTGNAYKNMKFFSEKEIMVQIGSRVTAELFSVDYQSTENMIITDKNSKTKIEEFEHYLDKSKYSNHGNFLNPPILIATIDYLMSSIKQHSNSHIPSLLRICTSDIILDEIDNFNTKDLEALNAFVFLCGLFKVNLMLSTATAMPSIMKSFYYSYNEGIKKNNLNQSFNTFIISDKENFIFDKTNKFEDFFFNAANIVTKNISIKRHVELIDIDFRDYNSANLIKQSILNLHLNNHEKDSFNNEFSVGYFRISNIKNIKKVTENLSKIFNEDLDNDLNFNIVMYHSQYPLIIRSYIEYQLTELLSRGDNKFLFEKDYFKSNEVKKRNILLVITSPVEEAGQDHDFDWSIKEFASSRSCTQSAGRVYRHRENYSNKTNILIMNRNFNLIDLGNKNKEIAVYTRPGYEESDNIFLKNDKRDLFNLFDLESLSESKQQEKLNDVVTNKFILKPTIEHTISFYENEMISENLKVLQKEEENFFLASNEKLSYPLFFSSTKNLDINSSVFAGCIPNQNLYSLNIPFRLSQATDDFFIKNENGKEIAYRISFSKEKKEFEYLREDSITIINTKKIFNANVNNKFFKNLLTYCEKHNVLINDSSYLSKDSNLAKYFVFSLKRSDYLSIKNDMIDRKEIFLYYDMIHGFYKK